MPHRKSLRRRHEPGHLHELTFSTYRQIPLLTNDCWRTYFCEALTAALPNARCGLIAWVLMPEHVHLLVLPGWNDDAAGSGDDDVPRRLSRLLAATKRPTSVRVKADLKSSPAGGRLLARLTVRERPGKTAFRFWQEGAGYDRNLLTPSAVAAAIDYIHANPVRRGLVERSTDWLWSSARQFAGDGNLADARHPPLTRLPPEFWSE
ncbi:transposase [Alienimonas chondri]|uniref:Transposase IS200-like domain-containing protein n=1 Tax=Alienimonas chondri TaxID=2681879 RepID=A0ABX1VIS4_9PLAN|nr:transposase [Alienimonas chondri]NNJ27667.1 hypothetical protein [Alienimonas chondri]